MKSTAVRTEQEEAELRRLQELSHYEVAPEMSDPQLKFIVELAVQTTGADIGAISLVYESTIALVAADGISLHELSRDATLCSVAIAADQDFFEVPDARADLRFRNMQLIAIAPHYRHYAAVTLHSSRGYLLGTLWVMARQPGQLDAAQRTMLLGLGRLVVDTLQLRYCDAVTGMYNRTAFLHRLQQAKSAPGMAEITVGYIDLSGFRQVNEVFGRRAGDHALAEMAARIARWAGAGNPVGHLGGDRFAFALRGPVADDVLDALRHAIDLPVALPEDRSQALRARIGIMCQALPTTLAAAALLDMAESAASSIGDTHGFSVVRAYGNELRNRSDILHDLLAVLEGQPGAGELVVHYQPQVNYAKQKLIGLEALVRWQHPERGTVAPSMFVPVAESTGRSYELDLFVMRQVCRDMRGWLDEGLPQVPVSLNFSRASLLHPRLPEAMAALIAEAELPAGLLEVEITESQLLEAPQALHERVEALRALGIRIAIDDFGIGYSNLDAIGSLPFDRLKVDRRFVHGVADSAVTASLFRLIQGVAEVSDAELLCEGLERVEDLDWLRHQHAYNVQGWYFSSAMPAEGIEDLLRTWDHRAPPTDVRELFAPV